MNDLSFFTSVFLIVAISGAAIGFYVGRRFGWEQGWLTGRNEEAIRNSARIISTKRERI